MRRFLSNYFDLVSYQMGWRYSDGNPLTGASNAGRVGRNLDSEPIFGLTACVNAATGHAGVVNAVAGGPRLLSRK